LKDDLRAHLQVAMDLNAEAPVQASLEVIEIVIGHAATRGLSFATLNPS
jgi:hypothetical protein